MRRPGPFESLDERQRSAVGRPVELVQRFLRGSQQDPLGAAEGRDRDDLAPSLRLLPEKRDCQTVWRPGRIPDLAEPVGEPQGLVGAHEHDVEVESLPGPAVPDERDLIPRGDNAGCRSEPAQEVSGAVLKTGRGASPCARRSQPARPAPAKAATPK